jgi:hypothetical protein
MVWTLVGSTLFGIQPAHGVTYESPDESLSIAAKILGFVDDSSICAGNEVATDQLSDRQLPTANFALSSLPLLGVQWSVTSTYAKAKGRRSQEGRPANGAAVFIPSCHVFESTGTCTSTCTNSGNKGESGNCSLVTQTFHHETLVVKENKRATSY